MISLALLISFDNNMDERFKRRFLDDESFSEQRKIDQINETLQRRWVWADKRMAELALLDEFIAFLFSIKAWATSTFIRSDSDRDFSRGRSEYFRSKIKFSWNMKINHAHLRTSRYRSGTVMFERNWIYVILYSVKCYSFLEIPFAPSFLLSYPILVQQRKASSILFCVSLTKCNKINLRF